MVVFMPFGLVSSLFQSTAARYKINASPKLGHNLPLGIKSSLDLLGFKDGSKAP